MLALEADLFANNITIWGRNAVVGTGFEELYGYDQALDFFGVLGAGAKLDVTSTSANDAAAGTGARTVRIVGLGTAYEAQSEVLTLTGQTIAISALSYTDVFAIDVITHGTGKTNAGDIHAVKTTTGGSYTSGAPGTLTSAIAMMPAGWGTTQNGHYSVPLGGPSYRLGKIQASAYTNAALLGVFIQSPWATDAAMDLVLPLGLGSTGHLEADLSDRNIVIGSKQTVRLRALAASASAVVQASLVLNRVS